MNTLNRIRARIPYAYWLLYDAVLGSLLVYGLARGLTVFAVGLPFLALAATFDIVEFIVKSARSKADKP
jgi:hypothetical protein